jgi:DNA-binding beta-propeller fold protein YncE
LGNIGSSAISGICKLKFPLIAAVFVLGFVLVPTQAEALDFAKNIGGQNDLMLPYDVEVDSQGRIIVTNVVGVNSDMGVSIFDSSGNLLETFGSFGTAPGEFKSPTGVAIDSKDRIIVADKQMNSIRIHDKSGEHIKTFGGIGSEDGQLRSPFGVAIDSQDRIIVADTNNNRVQIFDSEGNFVQKLVDVGSDENYMNYVADVATDSQDRIWVVDAQNNRLVIYDKEGKFVKTVGRQGGGDAIESWFQTS